MDSKGRTPIKAKVLNSREAKTIIAVSDKADNHTIKAIKKKGAEIIVCPEKNKKVDLTYLIRELGERGIDSILLEGGSTLNFSAIREGIVDKVYSFISPKMFGGDNAFTPVGGAGFERVDEAITLNIKNVKRFDEDLMIEAYIIKK